MNKILDGKAVSATLKDETKEKIEAFKKKYNREITLAVVLVGENPASQIYVRNKIKAAEYVGIKSLSFTLPKSVSQSETEALVKTLSEDQSVDGILVQLPLPENLEQGKILSLIPPEKDVDGFSSQSMGKLTLFEKGIAPCTPAGILYLLKNAGIELNGKNAVICGRSNIVGKPVALMLLKENCTVTLCHSKTENLEEFTKNADILISAIGKPKFIKADMVKDGAVVIDVGINRTENGLVGDVDFDEVKKKTSYITPVPGGVGPMTIAMLMNNAYLCALRRETGGF